MNTLVYHFGGLGDFITTLPLIAFWKQLHGGSVTLLGKPAWGEIAQRAGCIDTLTDADSAGLAYLFRWNSGRSELQRFFSPFDTMLLFAAHGSPLIDNARLCSRASIHFQPPFPDTRVPAVDYHLSLVTPVSSLTMRQRTPVVSIVDTTSITLLNGRRVGSESFVAIHPGSGSRAKNWPFDDFLAIAQRLRKRDHSIVWITGPAEAGMDLPSDDLCLKKR